MIPSNSDRMMLLGAASSFENRQLDIPGTRAHRRSASLTRRVNVFEEYDQTQSMNVACKIPARVNALEDSDQRQSLNDTIKTAVRAMKKRTNSLTSDRLARSRSTSNSTLLGDIGHESKLEVYDRIQRNANNLKSPPISPPRPHGGRASYNKALGDIVIARSISAGSENCSAFPTENEKMALRRQSFLTYSRRSTAFFPENQNEDRATSNALIQVEKFGYSAGPTTTNKKKDLTRRADTSGLRMEKEGQPNRDSYKRKGMKATLPADLLSKLESKSGGKKIKYDEMSDSYYDDMSDNLESIFDAGSALDNSTLQSGSQSGRDDRSAETGTTGTSDSSDTSDIIVEDLREEAAEMCGRTCHTLDASLRDIMQTRTYRILSMIGRKGARETIKAFRWIQKLEFSEISGCMDKSFKCVSAVMDAECERCEAKAKSCTE
jgi:hypothetical protein